MGYHMYDDWWLFPKGSMTMLMAMNMPGQGSLQKNFSLNELRIKASTPSEQETGVIYRLMSRANFHEDKTKNITFFS